MVQEDPEYSFQINNPDSQQNQSSQHLDQKSMVNEIDLNGSEDQIKIGPLLESELLPQVLDTDPNFDTVKKEKNTLNSKLVSLEAN